MESFRKTNVWIFVWVLLCAAGWAGALLLVGCSYSSAGEREPVPLRVTFLDVGQGLAVLLEREGRYALYDTGPDSAGLVDSLLVRGIGTLEWVLVSHGHRDHGGGFMEMGAGSVAGSLHVGRLLMGSDTAAGLVNDSIIALARRLRIPVDTLGRGDTVFFTEGVRMEVLWPPDYGRFGENQASVVMKVSMTEDESRASLLLTGDLDSAGERQLLELSPGLSADLLQVGHHGSSGSNTLRFLAQVAPRYAAIGVGKNNRYGHPTDEVLQKLRYVVGDSLAVFRTDLHGSVTFEIWPGIGVVIP